MKKICIIGASSGIGSALAEHYRDARYIVDVYTREIADLGHREDITRISQEIADGNYDIVIFSAGVGYYKEFKTLRAEQISEQIYVNTLAPLQILLSLSQDTKFVYLSSIMRYIPARNMSIYSAMKRATSQALQSIRYEDIDREILSIDLGAVKTPMHIKAGMKKIVGRDLERVIPKLITAIETKQGSTTLFWDGWVMIYIVFPVYRIFLKFTRSGSKY